MLMNFLDPADIATKVPPAKGKLLIAAPFLSDPSFARSVVFLCEHNADGTIGFVLNQMTALTLSDLVNEEGYMQPLGVYQGGPVEADTLHMLHRLPYELGGINITGGIQWGGRYDVLKDIAREDGYNEQDLKLFIGYSGWSPGQLEREMTEGSWLVGDATEELLFETEPHLLWKKAISSLGRNYSFLANMPIDPQLN
jgi:putative transcriptional regulator